MGDVVQIRDNGERRWPVGVSQGLFGKGCLLFTSRKVVGLTYEEAHSLIERIYEALEAPSRGRVYFIRLGDSGPIKIGWSHNPSRRLAQLQTSHPEPLQFLASIEGDRDTERALHERFAATRLRGEWFQPSDQLNRYISDIQDSETMP